MGLMLLWMQMVPPAPTWTERLMQSLQTPDVVVLVLALGVLFWYVEFNLPGAILPGSVGTLLVLLGGFALSRMPVNPVGLALLLGAAGLLVLEAKMGSHGVLALTGTVCLVIGLLLLVNGSSPEMHVHLAVALGLGVGLGLVSTFLATMAFRARRSKQLLGPEAMVGAAAVARTELAPVGQVEVRGELWRARVRGGQRVGVGEEVTVIEERDLMLVVAPCADRGVVTSG